MQAKSVPSRSEPNNTYKVPKTAGRCASCLLRWLYCAVLTSRQPRSVQLEIPAFSTMYNEHLPLSGWAGGRGGAVSGVPSNPTLSCALAPPGGNVLAPLKDTRSSRPMTGWDFQAVAVILVPGSPP